MYIYTVPHRLQITISEQQYAFLDEEANRSSVSIAELIRRAVDTVYGPNGSRRVVTVSHVLGRRTGVRLD